MNENTKLWIAAALGLASLSRLAPIFYGAKPHLATAILLIMLSSVLTGKERYHFWFALALSGIFLALDMVRLSGILTSIGSVRMTPWTVQDTVDLILVSVAVVVVSVVVVGSARHGRAEAQ